MTSAKSAAAPAAAAELGGDGHLVSPLGLSAL